MKRTVTVGMIIAAIILGIGSNSFAAGSKGRLTVSANVIPSLSQTMIRQERTLTITKENLANGYVDIASGTVIYIKSNNQNGYFLQLNIDGSLIKEARMIINGRSVSVSSGPGLIQQSFPGTAGETLQITYRLFLSPELKPGSYQWPLSVSTSLM